MRLFVVTLFAVLAFASPAFAVSNVSVDNTAPSAAAGARTLYKVGFTVGVALSGTDTMTVTLPAGTTTASWQGATVRDLTRAVDVGFCNNPNSGLIVTCGLFSGQSINASDQVLVTLRGITNPATPGAQTATVATSKETTAVTSSTYQVVGGNSITKPTVTIGAPSAAAGAKTQYVIGFSVSTTGGLSADAGSTITVVLPAGTNTSTWLGADVRDVTASTSAGFCNNPNSGLTITCGLFSGNAIAAGHQLQITLRGITNGAAGSKTLTVATTTDLPVVTSDAYAVVGGNTVSQPSVSISDPSAATGAKTRYVISFSVSATGGLSADAGSGMTVVLPAGTNTSTWAGADVRDVTSATDVGFCNNPNSALTVNCAFFSSAEVAAGDQLRITLRGLTNGTAGSKTLTVATTTDLPAVTSSAYSVVAGGSITKPTVAIDTPSPAAGAKTRYVIGFSVSATGGLSADAGSGMTVVLPAGTNTSTWAGADVRDVTSATDVGFCNNPNSALTVSCAFFSSAAVAANHQLRITLRGITNGTAGSKTLTVTTTTDTPVVTSDAFPVVAAGSITKPTVAIDTPSAAAAAKTRYVIGFAVSSTGGLSADAGSTLTVTLPSGTNTATWEGATVRDVTTAADVGYCNNPSSSLTVTCAFFSSGAVNPLDQVQITLRGITSGAAGSKTLTVATTSDLPAVTSDPYDVVANHAVSAVSARIGTAAPFAVVRFTTSTTGGLSADAGSSFTLTFPAGTTFPSFQSASVYDLDRASPVGFCGTPTGTVVTCDFFSGQFAGAGDTLRITFPTAVNTTLGATIAVASSSDTAASGTIAAGDTVSPDTTVTGTAPPFTLGSTEAGSTFECRIDGGVWASCSSPYTPTGVAAGQHTLDVRAIDPAGNPDLSPFVRGFTVAGGPQITSGPVGLTNDNTPTFTFTGTGTLTCRVDTAAFATCSSPLTTVALTDGTHTFDVRDSTATTASRTFTVDTVPPDTTIAGAGTFTFTGGSTYECSIDDGEFNACATPYTPPALPAGDHKLLVRALDAAGNRDGTPSTSTFTVAAPDPTPTAIPTVQSTPTPIPSATPTPTPVPGQTVVATGSGSVCVKRPGSSTCVPLGPGESIPLGSTVDTRKGTVEITASATDKAKFYDGIFKITQKGGYTNLALVETLAPCPKAKSGKAAAAKPKKRRLWGDGKGKFRTEGKYAAATVRGTKWLVEDSCAGTKTTVAVGVVDVRDNVLRKTIPLRAKKSYTAKPKR